MLEHESGYLYVDVNDDPKSSETRGSEGLIQGAEHQEQEQKSQILFCFYFNQCEMLFSILPLHCINFLHRLLVKLDLSSL